MGEMGNSEPAKFLPFHFVKDKLVDELASDSIDAGHRLLLMHKLDDLRMLKKRFVEKIGAKLERKTARKWYIEGELSTKYFFNLLNRNSDNDVKEVLNARGVSVTDPEGIEGEIRTFYKDLYESVPPSIEVNDDFFRNIESLSEDEAATMVRH